jgi:hypothetical protein
MSTKVNIVKLGSAVIELESPFKFSTGLKPDTNRCTCNYQEFAHITLGTPAALTFYYSSTSSADLTIANITAIDAEPVEYDPILGHAVKYRMVLIDARYAFVEPRGGRLAFGFINPSAVGPADADRTNVPRQLTMAQLIGSCLVAMNVSASVPDVSSISAPKDLKWFGTHAPTELEKLLEVCDLIFNLQTDGSYTLNFRNAGSDPSIPSGQALPATTFAGADARGKAVVFSSYPTQVINTITESDITPATDLTIVARNASTGSWQGIDASGVYGTTAITEMNNHFPNTHSPQDQSDCYRFLRLNPDKFDPLNSPILRKTFDTGGSVSGNPNGLPNQIDIKVSAAIAVQDPTTKLWTMPGSVRIPVDRVIDGNIIVLHHRLVKLKSGVTSTADLEGNCDPIDFAHDISIRLSIGSSKWSTANHIYEQEYYLLGYNGSAGSPNFVPNNMAGDLLGDPGTLVIPIAELVPARYGMNRSTDVLNLSALQAIVAPLAPRYLTDTSAPAREMEGVGFLPFTLDGRLTEVQIDQRRITTRFHLNAFFRPSSKHAAGQFHRVRHPKESHPHEGKTAGSRTAMGTAGSSQPVQGMSGFTPPASPGAGGVIVTPSVSLGNGVYTGNYLTGTASGYNATAGTLTNMSSGSAVVIINGPEFGTTSTQPYLGGSGMGYGPLPGVKVGVDSVSGNDIVVVSATGLGCTS